MSIRGPQERSLLEEYGLLAVILFGLVIVEPAWIGLLGWLMLSLFGWLLG